MVEGTALEKRQGRKFLEGSNPSLSANSMSFYSKYIFPKIIDSGMRPTDFNETRSAIANQASGVVLEIGFGSGYNLPFYKNTTKVYALEPSRELFDLAKDRVAKATFPVEYLQNSAEKIPLADNSIDTVISTWTLCSIPHVEEALREVYRVLKPKGRFVFVDHGRSPKHIIAVAQSLLTPLSRLLRGDCRLDRDIETLIAQAGFTFDKIDKAQEEGRPIMFSYRGVAVKK